MYILPILLCLIKNFPITTERPFSVRSRGAARPPRLVNRPGVLLQTRTPLCLIALFRLPFRVNPTCKLSVQRLMLMLADISWRAESLASFRVPLISNPDRGSPPSSAGQTMDKCPHNNWLQSIQRTWLQYLWWQVCCVVFLTRT
jgi:hypothetical protein